MRAAFLKDQESEDFGRSSEWALESPEIKREAASSAQKSNISSVSPKKKRGSPMKNKPAFKRLWSPDSRARKEQTAKISGKGKNDCVEVEKSFYLYKKMRGQNEKNMQSLLESNLKSMAEMLACKRDLQEWLKFYREELTNHNNEMRK